MVRRVEDAVKAEASQFAQRNREVRSDGLVASFQKGMDPAEYVGRTLASMVVDDALPAVAKGLKTVDEWTGGVLFECLKYVDPGQYNTWARRFLRDTCGLPQTFSQNVGDAIQYTGEAALLLGTFGSSSATKTAQLAGKAVAIPEIATTVNKTARIAEFEMAVAGTGDRILYNLRAMEEMGKAASGVKASGTPISQVRKLGLNVVEEKFKINWQNPNIMARGMEYENAVVKELEATGFTRLAPNTNTFDAFNIKTGHAVSIKSLDTGTMARVADPKQIEYLIDSYVGKVKGFSGIRGTEKQFRISVPDVKIPEIRIGVPKETILEQWKAMTRSAVKAGQQGVKITFGVGEWAKI
jgi:hypothetical protein